MPTLPVSGLPSQVTVQSTPAFSLSPRGVMLNLIVEPKASVMICCWVIPFAFVMEIRPAVPWEFTVFKHPTIAALSNPEHKTQNKKLIMRLPG